MEIVLEGSDQQALVHVGPTVVNETDLVAADDLSAQAPDQNLPDGFWLPDRKFTLPSNQKSSSRETREIELQVATGLMGTRERT